jgi:putative membrane protein
MTDTKTRIGAALRRGIVTTALLAAALSISAQQSNVDRTKQGDATSTTKRAGQPVDAATCIQEAAKMNLATVKFGQLASRKAQNAELKQFGQTLERDHQEAQKKLEPIAKSHNVSLPTTPDPKCEEEIAKLQALSGAEFDKEFAKGAVEGHAMAVAHLQKASTEVKDSDLSQYTKQMLTKVKEHQKKGREIAKAVGVDEATIAALESKAADAVGSAGKTSESATGTSSSNPTEKKDQ